LQNDKGILEVKLVSVPSDTALGGLKDLILFSKFTPNHTRPSIQEAGAGSAVTARGVLEIF
jgi:aspartokinase/homoserine dehydrogenase 1